MPRQCTGTVRHGLLNLTRHLCVSHGSGKKQRLYPYTAPIGLQPRYPVYCAVRNGYLKIISPQFTADSVVRLWVLRCRKQDWDRFLSEWPTKGFLLSASFRSSLIFIFIYKRREEQNPGNFGKQRNFGNRTAMYRKKNTFTLYLYASYFQSNVGERKINSIIILISPLVS